MNQNDLQFPSLKRLAKQLKRLIDAGRDGTLADAGDGVDEKLRGMCRKFYGQLSYDDILRNGAIDWIANELNKQKVKAATDWHEGRIDHPDFFDVPIFRPYFFRDDDGEWKSCDKLSLAELKKRASLRTEKRRQGYEIAVAQEAAIDAAISKIVARGLNPEAVYCSAPPVGATMNDEEEEE